MPSNLASCCICKIECVQPDSDAHWEYVSRERWDEEEDQMTSRCDSRAGETPDGRFVCSGPCRSQAMYQKANVEQQAALHTLMRWTEEAGSALLTLGVRPYLQLTPSMNYFRQWFPEFEADRFQDLLDAINEADEMLRPRASNLPAWAEEALKGL